MRKVRVIITGVGSAMPTLIATVLGPACGSTGIIADASGGDAPADKTTSNDGFVFTLPDAEAEAPPPPDAGPCGMGVCTFTVPVPPAGASPDLASVCVPGSPIISNTAATVTLTNFDANAKTADGFIAVKPELLAAMVGDPVITDLPIAMTTQLLTKNSSGFTFQASWPNGYPPQMTVKVTFQVACGDAGLDGGIQTVESTTDLELCGIGSPQVWESSGSSCIQCCVVCEMAPTPIVSDNHGDDLPLARALRLRVIELARAGRQVLLFAQNDAGPDAEYDWRVSGGSIERVADDVVVWTLPDIAAPAAEQITAPDARPFGQLAVWNDDGAIVENFYWGAA